MVPLAVQNGAPAKGHGGRCIFCGAQTGAPVHHVLADCAHWGEQRARALHAGRGPAPTGTYSILQAILGPGGMRCPATRGFATAIDEAARAYWRSKNGYWG